MWLTLLPVFTVATVTCVTRENFSVHTDLERGQGFTKLTHERQVQGHQLRLWAVRFFWGSGCTF